MLIRGFDARGDADLDDVAAGPAAELETDLGRCRRLALLSPREAADGGAAARHSLGGALSRTRAPEA